MNSSIEKWLLAKIAEAERTVTAREQAEATWRSGDDAEWAAVSKMHPSTRGKPMKAAERLKLAEMEGRILVKCRREVETWALAWEIRGMEKSWKMDMSDQSRKSSSLRLQNSTSCTDRKSNE